MRYRRFGRTGWEVSEIGYGMWGMAGWTNSNDEESLQSLQAAIDRGCNFFDTATVIVRTCWAKLSDRIRVNDSTPQPRSRRKI
jgi:predicted aldo/keto reductase-like oxidoreductase